MKKQTKICRVARKSVKGKRRTNYEQGTALEHELELFLKYFWEDLEDRIIFRTPASQTPADVWCVQKLPETPINLTYKGIGKIKNMGSFVRLYQCKSTIEFEPPEIDRDEFNKFCLYCFRIGARGYWVDRWKKNKNVYIRRLRTIDLEKSYGEAVFSDEIADWSHGLRIAQKKEKENKLLRGL